MLQRGRILICSPEIVLVILVKKMAAFCPCPKSLPEAKVKKFVL